MPSAMLYIIDYELQGAPKSRLPTQRAMDGEGLLPHCSF